MLHVGHLYEAYGYSSQGYDVFLASDLRQGENKLDPEEQGLVCREFSVRAVESMILDGTLKDGTTVAAFGLLRLKGLL
jgi:ADP-ribose pyrophosphatase